jgi:hypothetical protein
VKNYIGYIKEKEKMGEYIATKMLEKESTMKTLSLPRELR